MTEHREKAYEILIKFEDILCPQGENDRNSDVKKCALKHVDGIIDAFNSVQNDVSDRVFIYWAEVRKEIEKL